jgi:hypothetical protein
MPTYRTTAALLNAVQKDDALKSNIKADPVGALHQIVPTGPVPDTVVYRLVIIGLIVIVLVAAAGEIIPGANANPALVSLGATALGGLVGLLAPPPKQP